jgi:NAD(P)H-hydrate epimerase
LVLVGKGNNGGDALVAARRLAEVFGWRLTVVVTADRRVDMHLAAVQTPELQTRVQIIKATTDWSLRACQIVDQLLGHVDVVLDGLLGIGATGPLRGEVAGILARCEAIDGPSGQVRVAIDVPSGLNANTGEAATGAFRATHTLSTGPAKPGCYVGEGRRLAGRVEELDIGLPEATWSRRDARGLPDDGSIWRVGAREASTIMPARPDRSHKGSFGRVLIVGGCTRYPGAPVLASLGAIHGGAGVVSVARPTGATGVDLPPEVVSVPIKVAEDAFGPDAVRCLVAASVRMRALVIGPGLGTEASTTHAIRAFVSALPPSLPVVLDADCLNALAGTMGGRDAPWVVTPHAVEMSRLTGLPTDEVTRNPMGVARDAARQWGVVVILKGAPTVIASSRGTVAIGAYANAALATGGSGDALAGLVGALLAQGSSPWQSAVLGVTIHAVAGEIWRRDHGRSGARASQLAACIPVATSLLARMA